MPMRIVPGLLISIGDDLEPLDDGGRLHALPYLGQKRFIPGQKTTKPHRSSRSGQVDRLQEYREAAEGACGDVAEGKHQIRSVLLMQCIQSIRREDQIIVSEGHGSPNPVSNRTREDLERLYRLAPRNERVAHV